MLIDMGMTRETATTATEEIHQDETRALNFHLVQELGVDPSEKPSPWVAAGSSFVMFAIGAIIPLIPYLLGYSSLWLGLACGGIGLLIAGGVAARFTRKAVWQGSCGSWPLAAIAIAATYVVGHLIGACGRLSVAADGDRGRLVGRARRRSSSGSSMPVRYGRVATSTAAPSSTAPAPTQNGRCALNVSPSTPASHGATAAPPNRRKLYAAEATPRSTGAAFITVSVISVLLTPMNSPATTTHAASTALRSVPDRHHGEQCARTRAG